MGRYFIVTLAWNQVCSAGTVRTVTAFVRPAALKIAITLTPFMFKVKFADQTNSYLLSLDKIDRLISCPLNRSEGGWIMII